MAQAAGKSGKGRCLTTTLSLHYGHMDPAYSAVMDLLKTWLHIITQPNARKSINRCWHEVHQSIQDPDPGDRCRTKVKGPMSAVICTMTDLGWQVDEPWTWHDDLGNNMVAHPRKFDHETDWNPLLKTGRQCHQADMDKGLETPLWSRSRGITITPAPPMHPTLA